MFFRSLLIPFFVLLIASTGALAADPAVYNDNKRVEIKASAFGLVALDIHAGALYFTVEGTNLYYRPDADSTSARISTLTALLAEMRHARLVVVTYCDQIVNPPERYPGEIFFPAYAPLQGGALYRPVGAFFLQY